MKKSVFALLLVIGIFASQSSLGQERTYGERIDGSKAMAMGDLLKQMSTQKEMEATVEGKIVAVCQTKGCWMTLDKGDGTTMRVTFKDYGFFVPKDISGQTVIVKGMASVNVTSVEELRHYAEDAKKSKEEIAAITEPKRELVFEAEGVIVK
jgi:hypothetical protein